MDEGILVAYPALILHGAVPGRDFETFYGPGGPYLTAAAFELLGPHLWVERLVGLLARIVIVLAIFVIALPWGRRPAAGASIAAGVIMFPLGLAAYSLLLALGFVLAGLASAVAGAMFGLAPGRRTAAYVLAGVCSGAALLFRPDLLPAAVLPLLPVVRGRRRWRQVAAGFAVAVIPLVVYLAYVGPGRLDLLVRDLWASRPGRRLPPPSLSVSEGQLLAAATVVTLLFLLVGAILVWKRREDARSRLLLSIGVLLVALYPAIVNRADSAHILPVAAVAIPLFPILVLMLLRERAKGSPASLRLAAVGAVTLVVALTFLHVAFSGLRADVRIVRGGDRGFDVHLTSGRSFLVDSPATARDLDRVLAAIERSTSPGDSLFVGPHDLRRTNYNDAFVYYLLPKLEPASFYLELNPGTANRVGSSLAGDLKRADVLLLTTRYDRWNEPNDSTKPGSRAPSAVVARRFCRIAGSGTYTVLRRCRT